MKIYTDGKRKIYATLKAYNTLYKHQGFVEVKETTTKVDEEKEIKPKSTTKKK